MVKNPPVNSGDTGSIPGSGRSPGEGNSSPLQCSYLENPMDRGAWWVAVHGVAKTQTQLSDLHSTSFLVQRHVHRLRGTLIWVMGKEHLPLFTIFGNIKRVMLSLKIIPDYAHHSAKCLQITFATHTFSEGPFQIGDPLSLNRKESEKC